MNSNPALGATPAMVSSRSTFARFFYTGMILVCAAFVFAGFAPSFYLRGTFGAGPPLTQLLVIHGIVFSAWVMLLIAQTTLIRTSNVALHRKAGIAGAFLAAGMIVLGVLVALESSANGTAGSRFHIPPLEFLLIPLGQIAIFGVLMAAAIAYRRRPEVHKRLVIIATINLIMPAVVRLLVKTMHIASPAPAIIVAAALVLACIVFDYVTRRRVHPVFAIVGPLTLLTFPVRIPLSHTEAWHHAAAWLVRFAP